MAYDWKSKISNTGMLRFCSKVLPAQDEQKNDRPVSENTVLDQKGADSLHTVASGKDNEVIRTETIISTTTEARGSGTIAEESESSFPSSLEDAKLPSSGSATKRTSSRAGLISPKKKHASASSKNQKKCSTSKNQRMISDFFKK